jgi:hypothetical protein
VRKVVRMDAIGPVGPCAHLLGREADSDSPTPTATAPFLDSTLLRFEVLP